MGSSIGVGRVYRLIADRTSAHERVAAYPPPLGRGAGAEVRQWKGVHENPEQRADAFARAWFKLTNRDMGPSRGYLGPLVPQEALFRKDLIPAADHALVNAQDIAGLEVEIL